MNESENKKVVMDINAGIAKPIPISNDDALKIAQEQDLNSHNNVDITLEEKKDINETINDAKTEEINIPKLNQGINSQVSEINKAKLNEINDLVKVVDVKKSNAKVVIILIALLVIIATVFIAIEIPMIINYK
ncbi:MAG TPA: hypothetical protein PLB45_02180 [Bacilli bacterium]|jgi:hypothetical protein|nr:hypothetical protein [Bacilli bacterium]HQC83667.1 hypothetical protein [Bacilli bacterium]